MKIGNRIVSLKNRDAILLIILTAFSADYFFDVRRLPKPETNMVMIEPIFYLFVAMLIIYLTQDVKINPVDTNTIKKKSVFVNHFSNNRWIYAIVIGSIVYAIMFATIGFFIATILFTLFMMLILGVRNKLVLILVPLCSAVLFWLFFDLWFGIRLPVGIFSPTTIVNQIKQIG